MVEEQVPVPHPAKWGVLYRSSTPFWDAVHGRELSLQRCADCKRWLVPPRPMCPGCQSMSSEWVQVSGKGTICSWVTYAESPHPAFESPHTVVLVELEEGPRLVSNTVGIPDEELKSGLPVKVVYEDVDETLTLFKFTAA
jgi:uncharacterized OB-fold protein